MKRGNKRITTISCVNPFFHRNSCTHFPHIYRKDIRHLFWFQCFQQLHTIHCYKAAMTTPLNATNDCIFGPCSKDTWCSVVLTRHFEVQNQITCIQNEITIIWMQVLRQNLGQHIPHISRQKKFVLHAKFVCEAQILQCDIHKCQQVHRNDAEIVCVRFLDAMSDNLHKLTWTIWVGRWSR